MDVVHARCAALDVSKSDAKVCVRLARPDGGAQETVTTWGAMTRQIMELREYLLAQQVTRVVMEATGDYWKPFYYCLRMAGSSWCWPTLPRSRRCRAGRAMSPSLLYNSDKRHTARDISLGSCPVSAQCHDQVRVPSTNRA